MSKQPKTVAVHVVGIPVDLYQRMVTTAVRIGVGSKRSDVIRYFAVQGFEAFERVQRQEEPAAEAAIA